MRSGKTVLLVDDDGDFVEMNKVLLEENGYAVRTAFNAKQCLEKAKAEKPDLIEPDRTWLPVDTLIEKPVDPALLLSLVGRILSR
jgi:DNA-binding NtrC family response regulator